MAIIDSINVKGTPYDIAAKEFKYSEDLKTPAQWKDLVDSKVSVCNIPEVLYGTDTDGSETVITLGNGLTTSGEYQDQLQVKVSDDAYAGEGVPSGLEFTPQGGLKVKVGSGLSINDSGAVEAEVDLDLVEEVDPWKQIGALVGSTKWFDMEFVGDDSLAENVVLLVSRDGMVAKCRYYEGDSSVTIDQIIRLPGTDSSTDRYFRIATGSASSGEPIVLLSAAGHSTYYRWNTASGFYWESYTSPAGSNPSGPIQGGPEKFFAGVNADNTKLLWSVDGINWTEEDLPYDPQYSRFYMVGYRGGAWQFLQEDDATYPIHLYCWILDSNGVWRAQDAGLGDNVSGVTIYGIAGSDNKTLVTYDADGMGYCNAFMRIGPTSIVSIGDVWTDPDISYTGPNCFYAGGKFIAIQNSTTHPDPNGIYTLDEAGSVWNKSTNPKNLVAIQDVYTDTDMVWALSADGKIYLNSEHTIAVFKKGSQNVSEMAARAVKPYIQTPYTTVEPIADNPGDGLITVVLDHMPTTTYEGYFYIITD